MPTELYLGCSLMCGDCGEHMEIVHKQQGLFTANHGNGGTCVHKGKHFIVRLPRVEVLAESVAEEAQRPVMHLTEVADWPNDLAGMLMRPSPLYERVMGTAPNTLSGGNHLVAPLIYDTTAR